MNKKIFIGLFVISLIVLAGGCGGSSHSVSSTTDVNSALSGAWSSSSNGTATFASENYDDASALLEAFGELPGSVLEELKNNSPDLYELYESMNQGTGETINAPVTRTMVLFEDCNVSEDSGTAKLTAIVLVSGDDSFLPIVFNGITLSTRRNGTNEWTATVPDVGTLTINMASDEKMTLSGTVKYLGYDCGFSTVITKNPSNSIDPNTILNGTWTLNGTQGGGYLASGSQVIATADPETVSIFFSGTEANSQPSIKSLYSLRMRTSSIESYDETSLLQNITDGKGTLTNIHGNVYRFREADGNESIIFVENIDEIFVFMLENDDDDWQACMFLPLKKVSVDVERALNKTWRASEGEGGGYIEINNDSGLLPEFFNEIGTISLTLEKSTLSFSGATWNDDGTITATMNIATSFSYTNDILEAINFPADYLDHKESGKVTITPSANFLQFEYDGDVYCISFLSDTEAFLSLDAGTEGQGEATYYVRLSAE